MGAAITPGCFACPPHGSVLPWNQEHQGAVTVSAPSALQPMSSVWVSAGGQWPLGRGWLEKAVVAAG